MSPTPAPASMRPATATAREQNRLVFRCSCTGSRMGHQVVREVIMSRCRFLDNTAAPHSASDPTGWNSVRRSGPALLRYVPRKSGGTVRGGGVSRGRRRAAPEAMRIRALRPMRTGLRDGAAPPAGRTARSAPRSPAIRGRRAAGPAPSRTVDLRRTAGNTRFGRRPCPGATPSVRQRPGLTGHRVTGSPGCVEAIEPAGRPQRHAAAAPAGQWPASSPVSLPRSSALERLRPTRSTVLPRWAFLATTASRAATEEASQTCARERSMTTLSGSDA